MRSVTGLTILGVNQNGFLYLVLVDFAILRVKVRVAPTQDLGKMLQGLHEIPIDGEADIVRAVQTAQLALKHRMNKNQRQRIVLFVGSPIVSRSDFDTCVHRDAAAI